MNVIYDISSLDATVRRTWKDWKNLLTSEFTLEILKDESSVAEDKFLSLAEAQKLTAKLDIKEEGVEDDSEEKNSSIETVEPERFPWCHWKKLILPEKGITVIGEPDEPFESNDLISQEEVDEYLPLCRIEHKIDVKKWAADYQKMVENPPKPGDFIGTEHVGVKIKISVDLDVGKPPFMYTRIYVPKNVGARLGWFAQSEGDEANHGWKAVLTPKARDAVLQKKGLVGEITVASLRVERYSNSGHSVLVTVAEW